jgi:hypothetical protein
MTIDAWLRAATADADRRGLPELKPLLESLALATRALRGANFPHNTGGAAASSSTGSADARYAGSPIPPSSSLRS